MWVQIAILIVSALISHANRPKPEKPKPGTVETPVVKAGWEYRKVYGTVWIDDPQVIGFKRMGTDRIRTKGGKK